MLLLAIVCRRSQWRRKGKERRKFNLSGWWFVLKVGPQQVGRPPISEHFIGGNWSQIIEQSSAERSTGRRSMKEEEKEERSHSVGLMRTIGKRIRQQQPPTRNTWIISSNGLFGEQYWLARSHEGLLSSAGDQIRPPRITTPDV